MNKALRILFSCYSNIPYLFFSVFLLVVAVSAIIDGALVINETTVDMLPVAILAMACLAGIFSLPLVATALLVYNRHKWRKLVYPIVSYSLYYASVALAGYMGWWRD